MTTGFGVDGIHHVAIIGSDYARSKAFYTELLGFEIVAEHYRSDRESYKLDLRVSGDVMIELFSFPSSPPRPSRPEACGLRHLAFRVKDLDAALRHLSAKRIDFESFRVDEYTGKRFTFFADPDGTPLELYED